MQILMYESLLIAPPSFFASFKSTQPIDDGGESIWLDLFGPYEPISLREPSPLDLLGEPLDISINFAYTGYPSLFLSTPKVIPDIKCLKM